MSDRKKGITTFQGAIAPEELKVNKEMEKSNFFSTLMTSFGLNRRFYNLIVKVHPQKEQKISYTIVYTSGLSEIYLQDGVFLDYELMADKQTTFYYTNAQKEDRMYLMVSAADAKAVKNLHLKIYKAQDIHD